MGPRSLGAAIARSERAVCAEVAVAGLTLLVAVGIPPLLRADIDAASLRGIPWAVREVVAQGTLLLLCGLTASLGGGRVSAAVALARRRWVLDGARFALATSMLALVWSIDSGFATGTAHLRRVGAIEVLVPALSEEIVYRGLLPTVLDRALRLATIDRMRRLTTVALLTSLAFGLAHANGALSPHQAGRTLVHGLAGLAFFSLRARDGSLLSPMLAHAAYNGLVRLAMQ